MCGIAGIYAYRDAAPPVDREELLRVREPWCRAGRTGQGCGFPTTGVSGSRTGGSRSSISPMPARSRWRRADGRLRITFNGEIYNYRELRRELEGKGCRFRSQSDTEVLLHLYAERGAEMVHALRGMFAFGDLGRARSAALFLARDPFGIKPLYYADDGGTLRFASQVKALLAGGAIDTAPEPAGSHGLPDCWERSRSRTRSTANIRSLPAGSYAARGATAAPAQHATYFDVSESFVTRRSRAGPASVGPRALRRDAAVGSAHLGRRCACRRYSSRPASIRDDLAGLAAETGASDLHAVTLGFREFRGTPNDEVPLAATVARRYGVSARGATWIEREDFEPNPAILAAMDQPSHRRRQHLFVSRAAARSGHEGRALGSRRRRALRRLPELSPSAAPRSRGLALDAAVPRDGRRWCEDSRSADRPRGFPQIRGIVRIRRHDGRRLPIAPRPLHAVGARRSHRPHGRCAPASINSRSARLDATAHGVRSFAREDCRARAWLVHAQSAAARLPTGQEWRTRWRSGFRWWTPRSSGHWRRRLPRPRRLPSSTWPAFRAGPFPTSSCAARSPASRRQCANGSGAEEGAKERGLRKWARRVLPVPPRSFRVLALVTDAFGGHGGIAKFNRDLLTSVAAMPECAEVVCLPRIISRPVDGVPDGVRFVSASARGKPSYMVALLRALREGPYDLLIIGHINLAAIGVRAARRLKVPSQLIVHGIDAWSRHRSHAVRASLREIDRIVGVSQVTLDRLNAWAHLEGAKQRVLPNCVDLRQFTPGPKAADLVQSLRLGGRKVLMTFGRLASEERYKGFDEVIELMPALVAEIPSLVYLVCGDGPDRGRLEAKCAQLGVAERVIFTGFVDERRKPDYYRLADAYVMPSRGEGFGIVFLEAMACGIPVLGSIADGGREALLGGELGELVDPSRSDDVRAAILRTLHRELAVLPGLARFSREAFRGRVDELVREFLATAEPETARDAQTGAPNPHARDARLPISRRMSPDAVKPAQHG